MVHHPVDNLSGTLIRDEVSAQIQTRKHISVFQELAELSDMFVSQLLVFYLDLCWFRDSPAFDGWA